MHTATAIAKQPKGPFLDEVVLDYDHRHRRRIVLKGEGGHQSNFGLREKRGFVKKKMPVIIGTRSAL